jgi:glycosyltransferase involved in cell wall biosynthesis
MEALECQFCLNFYSSPVKLFCGHHICKDCIPSLSQFHRFNNETKDENEEQQFVIKCPTCNCSTTTSLPSTSQVFQKNLDEVCVIDTKLMEQVNQAQRGPQCSNRCGAVASIRCTTCGPLCDTCNATIHTLIVFATHTRVVLNEVMKQPSVMCCEHNTREAEVLCRDCTKPVCMACSQYGAHKDHSCILIDAYTKECKREVEQRVRLLNQKASDLETFSKKVDAIVGNVYSEHNHYEECVNEMVKQIEIELRQKAAQVIAKSRSIKEKKISALTRQQQILQSVTAQSKKHVDTCQAKLSKDNENYIELKNRLDNLLVVYNGMELEPYAMNGILVRTDPRHVQMEIQQCTSIEDQVVPSRLLAPIVQRVGRRVTITWNVSDSHGLLNSSYNLYMANLTQKRPYEIIYVGRDLKYELSDTKINCRYGFKVSAGNQYGEGRLSKESITKSYYKVIKSFDYKYNHDRNGILYWIGSGEGSTTAATSTYLNPIATSVVKVTCSSVHNQSDNVNLLGELTIIEGSFHTRDEPHSWICFDFGKYRVVPTYYTLRTDALDKCVLRNWNFQGSNDGLKWRTLKQHENDKSLDAKKFVSASWKLDGAERGYRYFRIHQNGKNNSGSEQGSFASLFMMKPITGEYILALGGFEIYGTLIEECEV